MRQFKMKVTPKQDQDVYKLTVKVQDEQDKNDIIGELAHVVSFYPSSMSGIIEEISEHKQKTYRSTERLKIVDIGDNQLQVSSEEIQSWLCICCHLNELKIPYELNFKNSYMEELSRVVKDANLEFYIEENDW